MDGRAPLAVGGETSRAWGLANDVKQDILDKDARIIEIQFGGVR